MFPVLETTVYYISRMGNTHSEVTQREQWRGLESIPRVKELIAQDVRFGAIAARFGITRQWLRKTLNKHENALRSDKQEG